MPANSTKRKSPAHATSGTKPSAVSEKVQPKRPDLRVRATRNALGDALIALMQERDFESITVQHVLDRANVGRSTFYAHFRDKDDLFFSDVEEFFILMSQILTERNASLRRLAPVREFFTHLREMRPFVAALARAGKWHSVNQLAIGLFARSFAQRIAAAGVVMPPVELQAHAHALAGSLFSLLDWWIAHDMAADPAEMDALFHRMAWRGIPRPPKAQPPSAATVKSKSLNSTDRRALPGARRAVGLVQASSAKALLVQLAERLRTDLHQRPTRAIPPKYLTRPI